LTLAHLGPVPPGTPRPNSSTPGSAPWPQQQDRVRTLINLAAYATAGAIFFLAVGVAPTLPA
jgi:hypothetical protein